MSYATTQAAVLAAARKLGTASTAEIARECGLMIDSARKHLSALRVAGHIRGVGGIWKAERTTA